MTKAELARAIGVTKTTIGQWESGQTAPNRNRISQVARVLNWKYPSGDPRYTEAGRSEEESQHSIELAAWGNLVSLLTTSHAHSPIPRRKGAKTIRISGELPADSVATTVIDDAMAPFIDGVGAIEVGDIIIVSRSATPKRGSVVIAQLGNKDPVLRQYVPRTNGAFDLVATNPDYPTVTVNKNNNGKVLAVVVEHRRRLHR